MYMCNKALDMYDCIRYDMYLFEDTQKCVNFRKPAKAKMPLFCFYQKPYHISVCVGLAASLSTSLESKTNKI